MAKIKRTRNRAITVRISESEYSAIMERIEDSGLTKQSFFINALLGVPITTSDEITVVKETNQKIADLEFQLVQLSRSINNLANNKKSKNNIIQERAMSVLNQVSILVEEGEEIWASLRSLTSLQKIPKQ